MYQYGDDFVDTTKNNKIEDIEFLLKNYNTLKDQIDFKAVKNVFKNDKEIFQDFSSNLLEKYRPFEYLGVIPIKYKQKLKDFIL